MSEPIQNGAVDPGNTREGEPTAVMTFPHGLVTEDDRVQQPGTTRGTWHRGAGSFQREKYDRETVIGDMAADKFAVVTVTADQQKAYQLLPADYDRKSALIYCINNPIYLGDETSVSNAVGQLLSAAVQPLSVFPLPPSVVTGTVSMFAFEYTSKQGLYVCGAAAAAAIVFCFVEKFKSGTPVR